MLTVINDANIQDFIEGVKYLLAKSDTSEEVFKLAQEIVQGKPDPIKAIFDWVRAHVKYTPDPGDDELFISPIKLVEYYRSGKPLEEDCDGFAMLTTALCRAVGLTAHVCFVAQRTGNFDHAICEVWSIPLRAWIQVDTSTDLIPLGWETPFRKVYVIE